MTMASEPQESKPQELESQELEPQESKPKWKIRDRFVEVRSPWMTLLGEHLEADRGEILEYWRIERADSAVILPILNQQLVLLPPTYRPGIGQATLDFPGGRVADGKTPAASAAVILQRELGVEAAAIAQLTPLNTTGWPVNSSFSNQTLYGFVAQLAPSVVPGTGWIQYPASAQGVRNLLQVLTCLQCRAVLLEWWLHRSN